MAHATSHQLVMVASRAGPLAHLVSHTDNALVDGCSSEEAKQAKGRGGWEDVYCFWNSLYGCKADFGFI